MKQKAPIDDRLLQYKFPETQEKKLNNGLTVIVIERPVVPKIYFRLALNVGEKYDPPEMEGAFEMMARLLKKGTEKRSYSEIVEAIDFAGGMLEANSSKDFCYVYGEFLKEHSDLALNLLSEVVMHPLFLPEELEKERAKMIAELENEKSSPAFLAQRQMDNALYFPHPYARFKTKDSLQRITRQALEELHQQYFAPQNAFLAIGGDLTFKQIMNQLENKCSSWRERESNISEIEPPAHEEKRFLHLVDRPGSEQTNLLLGRRIFSRNHPDFAKAQVANKILGGGASGRLFLTLREKKGYTYGAYSSLDLYKESGGWIANAEVRNEVVDKAIRTFYDEFRQIKEEQIKAEELRNAKRYLVGSFPLKNEKTSAVNILALWQKLYHLPDYYWEHYLEEIDAITAEDVRKVVGKYLQQEKMPLVVVGDAKEVEDKIKKFGDVYVYDADGNRTRKLK